MYTDFICYNKKFTTLKSKTTPATARVSVFRFDGFVINFCYAKKQHNHNGTHKTIVNKKNISYELKLIKY